MNENYELIQNIKKSQDDLMNSANKSYSNDNSKQIQSRYAASSIQELEESYRLYNNQTFSTFGPDNDIQEIRMKDIQEDRLRPARSSNSQASLKEKQIKHHDSLVKEEIRNEIHQLILGKEKSSSKPNDQKKYTDELDRRLSSNAYQITKDEKLNQIREIELK